MGHFDEESLRELAAQLTADGVDVVRIGYSDLIGTERGRDVLVDHFARTVGHGVAFCRSVYGTSPMGDVVDVAGGVSAGLPDIVAFPDVATARKVPWEPGVAHVIADVFNPDGSPSEESPRMVLKRVVEQFAELDMIPIAGPELEFYVVEPDESAINGYRRYGEATGNVYVSGLKGDPENILLASLRELAAYDIDVVAANHEFSSGQFEINLWHSEALDAADRAFRFKTAVKELARRQGKMATFMAKPFNDEGGSGFHLHFSTLDDQGRPLFDDPAGEDGLSKVARSAIAGVLAHAPALAAISNPDHQLLQAVRPGHPRAVAGRLGSRQPQRDDPHPARAWPCVPDGAAPRRRVGEPVPRDRRPAGGGVPRHPRRPRAAREAGGLRLRHVEGEQAAR